MTSNTKLRVEVKEVQFNAMLSAILTPESQFAMTSSPGRNSVTHLSYRWKHSQIFLFPPPVSPWRGCLPTVWDPFGIHIKPLKDGNILGWWQTESLPDCTMPVEEAIKTVLCLGFVPPKQLWPIEALTPQDL